MKKEEYINRLKKLNIIPDIEILNQNFLLDENSIKKIISYANLKKGDIVLEIGTGLGILTKEISKKVKKIITLEIDKRLNIFLKDLPKNVELINDDAKKYIKNQIKNKNIIFNKIISSPPYNLCEPFLHLLTKIKNIESVIMVVPEGFYEKINSHPVFSSFFNFEKKDKIEKENFYPVPKKDSEIIIIKLREPFEKDKDELAFIRRNLYIQKDKKLKNILRSTLINLYKLKGKILTKRKAREIINSLEIKEKLLNKKFNNCSNKIFIDVSNKLYDKIKFNI